MRKGFAGLSGLVRLHLSDWEVMNGDVFIFINRRADRIKLLMWDKTGFALYYKQLERGSFSWPRLEGKKAVELSSKELFMLLEGLEKKELKQRKRYKSSN